MRAPRFPLELPVWYRLTGERTWVKGTTVNISSSGVLFRAGLPLEVNTPVEMSIVLSGSPAGTGEVKCEGHIVRLESSDPTTPMMAAAFFNYDLHRPNHANHSNA